MKLPHLPLSLLLVFVCLFSAAAQKPGSGQRAKALKPREVGRTAIVIDESLSLLRTRPSLFASSLQRMRRGRRVRIVGAAEADGVRFFKILSTTGHGGWLQSDAVFGKFRAGDEERFARLVQATDGFEQIELADAFFAMYPTSRFRPPILLLFGDLLEAAAAKLSRDANSRLSRREMAATGAPAHSYYLNFNMLDRYRRTGVTFLFNSSTRNFHYDGASWREIVHKHSSSPEAVEAAKRLDSLRANLDKQ